jgi:hypothetical protein
MEELPPDLHPQVRRPAEPVGRYRKLPRVLARAIDSALSPEAEARPSLDELAVLLEHVPGVMSPRNRRPASDAEIASA